MSEKKKKVKLKRTFCEIGEKLQLRTTKCSLTSLLASKHPTFKNILEKIILSVNQIETLASLVVKHHLFQTLESENSISFEIDQNYFSKVFTYLTSKPRGTPKSYENNLKSSVQHILSKVQPDMVFNEIALTQIFQFASITMLTNFRVHIQMHLERSFISWTKNQIRAIMTDQEFENPRKYMKSYIQNLEKYDFYEAYKFYETEIGKILGDNISEDLENEEDTPSSKFQYNQGLRLMWKMRKESEQLEMKTVRTLKAISVIPQNQMKCGSVRLDTTVMVQFYQLFHPVKEEKTKNKKELLLIENQRRVWNEFFNMDKLEKIRPHQAFNWSLSTDGISVNVLFAKRILKSQSSKNQKKPKTSATKKPKKHNAEEKSEKEILTNLPIGNYSETYILNQYQNWSSDIHWVSIDPGVRNLLATWSVENNTSPYNLGQSEYRQNSGLTRNCKWMKNQYQHMKDVKLSLTENAYRKSVIPERMDLYLDAINLNWSKIWQFQSHKKIRRMKFTQWIHQQKFQDKVLQKIKKSCQITGKQTILLFGKAGSSGFGKLKGGGVKGPVVRLRGLLGKRFPIIHADEFRTSKCCWECGKVLCHPNRGKMHGVSYCNETDHHRMLNRDTDAARKIGYRFLQQLQGNRNLGPWDRSFKEEDLNLCASRVFFNLSNQKFPRRLGESRVPVEKARD